MNRYYYYNYYIPGTYFLQFGACDRRDMTSYCICTLRVKTERITGSPDPIVVTKGIAVPRVLCHSSLTEATEVPGKGMWIIQNLQKFQVRVRKCSRTHRSSRYCGTFFLSFFSFFLWHGRTKLTEVPGRYSIEMLYPYPGHLPLFVGQDTLLNTRRQMVKKIKPSSRAINVHTQVYQVDMCKSYHSRHFFIFLYFVHTTKYYHTYFVICYRQFHLQQ